MLLANQVAVSSAYPLLSVPPHITPKSELLGWDHAQPVEVALLAQGHGLDGQQGLTPETDLQTKASGRHPIVSVGDLGTARTVGGIVVGAGNVKG
jgi:hypothetical protein